MLFLPDKIDSKHKLSSAVIILVCVMFLSLSDIHTHTHTHTYTYTCTYTLTWTCWRHKLHLNHFVFTYLISSINESEVINWLISWETGFHYVMLYIIWKHLNRFHLSLTSSQWVIKQFFERIVHNFSTWFPIVK